MSANFTPDMTGYKGLSPFRFWCQKTLPLVYDDSLSYYELLCKVVSYINNLITDVAAAEENVDKLLTAYNQLQEYVNNYFDGADFQQKIDDSLDRYAEDGTLSAMVNRHVSALLPYEVGQQIGDVVDEQLPPVVDLKLGAVVDNKLPDVVDDKLEDVVRPMIVPAVSGLLPQEVGRQLPDEVETQLPGAISENLGTIAPPVIQQWLNDHPDATTSVEDGSISLIKLNEALNRIANVSIDFFPTEYDSTHTYYTGDMCTYKHPLNDTWYTYVCIDADTGITGAFDSLHWSVIQEYEIVSNKQRIYDVVSSIAPIISYGSQTPIASGTIFFYTNPSISNNTYRLHRATTDISAPVNVNSTNAERITILDLIGGIETDVDDLKSALTNPDDKNLFWVTDRTNRAINGIDFTFNEDGSITAVGTTTGGTNLYLLGDTTTLTENLPAGTYTFTRWITEGTGNLRLRTNTTNIISTTDDYYSTTVTFTEPAKIFLQIGNNVTVNGTFRFQIEASSTASEYFPAKAAYDSVARARIAALDSSVNSDLSGKAPINSPAFTGTPTVPDAEPGSDNSQIANTKYVKSEIDAARDEITASLDGIISPNDNLFWVTDRTGRTINGISFTFNEDGSITAVGESTVTTLVYIMGSTTSLSENLPAGTYTFTRWSTDGAGNLGLRNNTTDIIRSNESYVSVSVTMESPGKMVLRIGPNVTLNGTFWFKIETGDTGSEYTPAIKQYANDAEARMIANNTKEIVDETLIQYRCNAASISGQHADESIQVMTGGNLIYELVHSVYPDKNADNWHIWCAHLGNKDFSFVSGSSLTLSGEWECAVRMVGWNDFSGGHAHGNEKMMIGSTPTTLACWADGKRIPDITDVTRIQTARELRIYEVTTLYNNLDSSIAVAEHGKEYIFTCDGLTINQSLKWLVGGELDRCYLAMFPASKEKTTGFIPNTNFQKIAFPSSAGFSDNYKDVTDAFVYGDNFTAEFGVKQYPEGLLNGDTLLVTDNDGGPYNKMYYVICKKADEDVAGQMITAGELWKTTSVYKLKYVD